MIDIQTAPDIAGWFQTSWDALLHTNWAVWSIGFLGAGVVAAGAAPLFEAFGSPEGIGGRQKYHVRSKFRGWGAGLKAFSGLTAIVAALIALINNKDLLGVGWFFAIALAGGLTVLFVFLLIQGNSIGKKHNEATNNLPICAYQGCKVPLT